MIRGIVFDLDDTLFAERDFVFSGFREVGKWVEETLGLPGFAESCWKRFLNGERGQIFNRTAESLGLRTDSEFIEELLKVYRRHRPEIRLFPDAVWALQHFRRTYRLGIITDGWAETQRNKVAALDLERTFRSIIITDDLGRSAWKPSPVPFLNMAAALNLAPTELVYVGDNPLKDFLGARQLGWSTVRIRRPGGEYAKQVVAAAEDADVQIETLLELESALDTCTHRSLKSKGEQALAIPKN